MSGRKKEEYPVTILSWGSAGPNGDGHWEITVRRSTGEIEIEEEDWMGGHTNYFTRRRARQLAQAILKATERPRKSRT
jgi:hypothetical protein